MMRLVPRVELQELRERALSVGRAQLSCVDLAVGEWHDRRLEICVRASEAILDRGERWNVLIGRRAPAGVAFDKSFIGRRLAAKRPVKQPVMRGSAVHELPGDVSPAWP